MKNITGISKVENVIHSKNTVIMNAKTYNKNMLDKDIEEHLLRAEDDIRNGRVRDMEEVFKEWKEKYGI